MRTFKFFITNYDSGDNQSAHPIYADGFGIVSERESGQIFFRDKLSDKLTFVAEDYSFIMAQPFDSQIDFFIQALDDGVLALTWHGTFSRTDCTINEIDGVISVTPEVKDQYTDILNVLDVEVNLAELDIEQTRTTINVPPVLQLYHRGANYVENYWQGEIWETEVDPIVNTPTLEDMGFYYEHFAAGGDVYCRIILTAGGSKSIRDAYNINNAVYDYSLNFNHNNYGIDIVDNYVFSNTPTKYGERYINGVPSGQYYTRPSSPYYVYLPIFRSLWDNGSVWLRVQLSMSGDIDSDLSTRSLFASYTLGDVLQGLLSANSLLIDFYKTTASSQFFYGTPTPITNWAAGWYLNFTAKSNILNLGADTPATNVPCTLATVLNFLKNAMDIYWYVDNGGVLHLEHISYFKNGGTYGGTPLTQYDLTQIGNPRSGKPWAWGQNQYQFEKYDMPQFVKWSWMDETDFLFDGSGFECKSNYVAKGRTEEITVANITTNIVKMFMHPDDFSLDGLAVIFTAANGKTDHTTFARLDVGGTNWRAVNGELAMWNLQKSLLLYDAPCDKVQVSGSLHINVDYKRTKFNEVTFPALTVDPAQHITTNVGDGAPETITYDLTSDSVKIKLKYGNE